MAELSPGIHGHIKPPVVRPDRITPVRNTTIPGQIRAHTVWLVGRKRVENGWASVGRFTYGETVAIVAARVRSGRFEYALVNG